MPGPATVAATGAVQAPPPADPAPPGGSGSARWDRPARMVPSVVPGAVMLGVGLVGADRPALSWDEASTADVAQRSVADIWHLAGNIDAVLGSYYFVMHGWTSLAGTTELDLRLPSIVAMA